MFHSTDAYSERNRYTLQHFFANRRCIFILLTTITFPFSIMACTYFPLARVLRLQVSQGRIGLSAFQNRCAVRHRVQLEFHSARSVGSGEAFWLPGPPREGRTRGVCAHLHALSITKTLSRSSVEHVSCKWIYNTLRSVTSVCFSDNDKDDFLAHEIISGVEERTLSQEC